MLALFWIAAAHALPGTHAPVVATWDTRASTLGAADVVAPLPNATLSGASHDTDCRSTSARLSSQLGVHAMQRQVETWEEPLRGLVAGRRDGHRVLVAARARGHRGVLQVSSPESARLGRSVGPFIGGTVVWQWDAVVPAVLPGGVCDLPNGHDG